jgi:hypothetical protein
MTRRGWQTEAVAIAEIAKFPHKFFGIAPCVEQLDQLLAKLDPILCVRLGHREVHASLQSSVKKWVNSSAMHLLARGEPKPLVQ